MSKLRALVRISQDVARTSHLLLSLCS